MGDTALVVLRPIADVLKKKISHFKTSALSYNRKFSHVLRHAPSWSKVGMTR